MAISFDKSRQFVTICFRFGLLICAIHLFGCQRQSEEAGKTIEPSESSSTDTSTVATQEELILNSELWDAVYISGHQVGHTVTRESHLERAGKPALRTTQESLIRVNRNNSPTEQRIRTSSLESAEGEIIEFDAMMTSGISEMKFHGKKTGENQLEIQQTAQDGRALKTRITIPPDCRGFFGTEQELRRRPLSPGESRTIPVLAPIINAVVSVEMTAKELEQTELIGTSERLLRIDVKNKMPSGQVIPSTMWVDKKNEIVKSTLGSLQTNYRTSKEIALKQTGDTFDLGNDTMVSVSPPLKRPHGSRSIKYLARLSHKSPGGVFFNDSYQKVESKNESEAIITVVATSPSSDEHFSSSSPPTVDDKTANSMVQSNHPLVQKMARRVVPSETDPWKIAIALEKLVHETVVDKNFSTALASALEVANSKAGDCTEHSVLLVALCRSRSIPARAAIGLVYVPSQQAFGYHMWTEVWIADRWIPLDATLGQGGIGGAHLKVSHTNFSASNGFESFLPVLDLMGKLELSVLEAN